MVHLPHVSLGDLRRRYPPHNTGWDGLHPAIKRRLAKFKRHPLDSTRPLEIYGSDKGLFLVSNRIKNPEALQGLVCQVVTFPSVTRGEPPLPPSLITINFPRDRISSRHVLCGGFHRSNFSLAWVFTSQFLSGWLGTESSPPYVRPVLTGENRAK